MTTQVLFKPRLDVPPRDRGSITATVWRVGDPRITLASVAAMGVGAAAAAHDGAIAWGWLALTVLGILCVEAAKHAWGDTVDGDPSAERFTRTQRVLVAGAGFVAAAAIGLAIAQWREPDVLWLGIAGVAIAFGYHVPPLELAHRGLGEVAAGLVYGPLIATGTYLVQRGHVSAPLLATALPLGAAIGAFLWIDELPAGRERAGRWFFEIVAAANLAVAILPLLYMPMTLWLGLAGLPHALAAASRLAQYADRPRQRARAQAWALTAFLLMALGLGAGWLLA